MRALLHGTLARHECRDEVLNWRGNRRRARENR